MLSHHKLGGKNGTPLVLFSDAAGGQQGGLVMCTFSPSACRIIMALSIDVEFPLGFLSFTKGQIIMFGFRKLHLYTKWHRVWERLYLIKTYSSEVPRGQQPGEGERGDQVLFSIGNQAPPVK